jgi:hypothetical protein
MKLQLISGLIALQLAAGITAQGQNYYVKITGDQYTRIADHAIWEQGPPNLDESLEAYNLSLPQGLNAIGTMRFHAATGSMTYAKHYRLNNASEQVVARKILLHGVDNSTFFVIGEKVKSGVVISGAVLYYNRLTGNLDKSWELPALPSGYEFLHIYDAFMELGFNNQMRILCTIKKGSTQAVVELLFNIVSGQYKVRQYKPARRALNQYSSVYYLRTNHYGMTMMGGTPSFYGMGISDEKPVAFCYSNNRYEEYRLFSALGREEITGVQMNGSAGFSGNQHQIDMAFTDAEGDICIQQKHDMTTVNWRHFYHLTGGKLRLSMGRDGHGTKGGSGMHYFIATAEHQYINDPSGHITTLHYNAFNGAMSRPNVWNRSGIGINNGGGFPNCANDPGDNYTFIADRFNQKNGFKFGTGNAFDTTGMPCTEQYELKEANNTLKEFPDQMNVENHGSYNALPLNMLAVADIRVEVIEECSDQQRNAVQENTPSLLKEANSTLVMNAGLLRIAAQGKTIASLRLLSVDGRLVAEARNINSSCFQQQFAQALVPGIYIVNISYTDHSTEVRKVGIQ